MALDTSYVFVV